MPVSRTLRALSLAAVLLGLAPGSLPAAGPAVPVATLPLLAGEGKGRTAALLVRDETGTRFARSGPGIRRADHFRAGSITKTFLATVVLQLAAEGRLSLSDTVEQHLPGLVRGRGNDGRLLTLRELLDHTSGLHDFTADTGGTVPLAAAGAVRLALSHRPSARGVFAYSNTDYVLLGMVIEAVTGESYAAEARQRIIGPLHLAGTSFPGARRDLPEPHGRAYTAGGREVTDLDPRVAGAAGEVVSTLTDLDRFYSALLGGRLLPAAELARMLDTGGTGGAYGLGIYPQRLPCGVTVWGHNGRIRGSYVRSAAVRGGERVLTYRVDADAVPPAAAERALLTAEFCPR
ncbi:hypothetical protein GCM10018793_29860 [Streptomyces sulfonofaciens]|uniref:Beta-lactamase-related domain-containing protein n=1 Tax=Streptomyces sulfonofaciens TaxID=68272 RepID=A0A919L0Z0_9ACTN|nr:serine hydrolase domain-containing protein [Streptomyces sulfonofaciens]GHH78701.1 hypothetical protein GCM10018793_29860 [Streptomyces sulfonofaciens]